MVLNKEKIFFYVFSLVFLILLFLSSFHNYLLFHTFAELMSIVISVSVFIIAWNSKQYLKNNYLIFIGIAYLFIGFLDLMHTISYKGMNIFTDYDYYANQLWVIARYMESLTLLIGLYILSRKEKINEYLIFVVYFFITAAGIFSVYYLKIFPVCFTEGEGQTTFKIVSEYIINVILVCVLIVAKKRKHYFEKDIYLFIRISIVMTIISELAFTFYVSNYGISNMIGHYAKLFSFYMIYRAIIEKGIRKPYSMIFKELNEQKEELIEANQTKDRFFSIIAHDLKNPFNALLGFLNLLSKDFDKMDDQRKKQMISYLEEASKNLYSLLTNLLEWSRIHLDKIDFQPVVFDLHSLLVESVEIQKLIFQKKEIRLIYENQKPYFVYADRNMILAVMRNLLTNAVKYTPRGGEIRLVVGEDEGMIYTGIIDSGVGMNEKVQESVFKLDSKISMPGTDKESGTGLGLLLSKDFIEKNSGRLWFKSQLGKGSSFYFSLPVSGDREI